ncbi:aminotransferase class V-fold PLP-dependent enzyme [Sphingomonas sp. SFZ2018-12]|uniref:cysteine desulfurase family protein n=1 Tax=Sphingomonas sp. SFZ2018-12 TaxID=2683197 RepID=UPI001F112BFF|nr:aminotransferase class V-fold PLP-dependent enzyme [Sphingomonas sp. SFZ2018-12]MCH4892988.1 aminotransferase class V-fold PLP-dependent enzyme [Sphingomonas sp. SFZ2018-12]
MSDRRYFDHAATTPMVPAARDAVIAAIGDWANPSSPHGEGRAARAAIEAARAAIARGYGWPGEVIFTSGATEAIAIGIGRAQVASRMVGATEHDAVLRVAGDAVRLRVDPDGEIDLDVLTEELARATAPALVCVQWGNSETGVLQPIAAIAERVKAAGGVLFVDAAQMPAHWDDGDRPQDHADLIAVSAHKRGGPPGVGALLVRDLAQLLPSGGQERGYRGGTENVPGAVGFAAALDAPEDLDMMAELRERMEDAIVEAGGEVIAEEARRSPLVGAYRMPGAKAAVQLIRFDVAGFAVSAGSACSSGSMRPSHVLAHMGIDADLADEVIRISFGRPTTAEDVDALVATWTTIAEEIAHGPTAGEMIA